MVGNGLDHSMGKSLNASQMLEFVEKSLQIIRTDRKKVSRDKRFEATHL
jgi:hypothetical protein